jgi:hypothetical protein
MNVIDRIDQDIANKESLLEKLQERTKQVAVEVDELKVLRAVHQEILSRYGSDEERSQVVQQVDEAERSVQHEWRQLMKWEAVERALREADAPMTLSQINDYLVAKGRPQDRNANISAAITYLRQNRETVERVAPGTWQYVEPSSGGGGAALAALAVGAAALGGYALLKRPPAGPVPFPARLVQLNGEDESGG